MATRPAPEPALPAGGFVRFDGEDYYLITDCHRLPPFLMSIPSDTDLWMFLSSRGGLTAGRVDAQGSLFPYETVDRLHDAHRHTGPVTLLRVRRAGGPPRLWQPFTTRAAEEFRSERGLGKNIVGNRVFFEEINHDLGLAFRCRWTACEEFGFVREATLTNLLADPVEVELLDGLRNVLPYGAPLALHQQASCLVDAYRRADRDPETGLAIFSLTAAIVDRPEAAEQLRANTVWCRGLDGAVVALAPEAVAAFRRGEPVRDESLLTGRRGCYLAVTTLTLAGEAARRWQLVVDAGRDHLQVAALLARLRSGDDLAAALAAAQDRATAALRGLVAAADGLQSTGDATADAHHFANVLFNGMRGGFPDRNHDLPAADFAAFVRDRHRAVAARRSGWLDSLPTTITVAGLLDAATRVGDADLVRLAHEYLPLWFSRRHGDPSRPWNRFRIAVRDAHGARAFRYEGNWRDIFQNWEALACSYPGFLYSFIAKFLNASTVDGFNPYRLTRDGVDWEVPDPREPWGCIGYWGDHQLVYLLKFLEAAARHDRGALVAALPREIYSYADVPYRLRAYRAIVADPRATVDYDAERAARVAARERELGADGRLVPGPDGAVRHASLLEKLLVPALSKLSNLVPGAGIWMNTQRPEWNDANNALVGNGVSAVTLCYLRRYLAFLAGLLATTPEATAPVAPEVADWLRGLRDAFAAHEPRPRDDRARRALLDALGGVFADYRATVASRGLGAAQPLATAEAAAFCRAALAHVDHAVRANRRDDALYHAYLILDLPPDGGTATARPLDEMLEGQVAALSSGALDAAEAVALLDALFRSRLYRPDQRSFLLYPARELPSFIQRNLVPDELVAATPLLHDLLVAGDVSVVARDALGSCRFHGDFRHAADVAAALDRLAAQPQWAGAVSRGRRAALDAFEAVFRHRSFTGRSQTMYAYEGLGCIYWHMVAKLLLAVQETCERAERDGASASTREALARHYHRIRSGLGSAKTVAEYGAFPADPYSHTPRDAGAQQPGMTGQVKEEILTRFGELGARVVGGRACFRPALLRRAELRSAPGLFSGQDAAGRPFAIEVPAGALAFTWCGTPVVYTSVDGEDGWIRVTDAAGKATEGPGDRLDTASSRSLFARDGRLARIEVGVPSRRLRDD